ncbi:Ger(x)C family spore germination protein [Paenibacillus filicis]|uniref:Ger(X)C family spore germination protein n=1 Tax=Paenibacillus gyeongsangnamensis TaxID=3388067 RepID=A0ABT4Q3J2_9BACL|nr:Ger(x)C family spore germination protein [Paenibacillus filicis]MCZ8511443.1 Ger(x)C family spore germination protein [Paenibacillus filicis]
MTFARRIMALVLTLSILSGCMDQINLEDVLIDLIIGYDMSKDEQLLVYTQAPQFSKEAKDKTIKYSVKALNFPEAESKFNSLPSGISSIRKVQIILISKRLAEHEQWHLFLDSLHREVRMDTNAKVILVDGSVSDLLHYTPRANPLLYLSTLLKTGETRHITPTTTIRNFHRQLTNLGITPFMPVVKLDKLVKITGTALFDKDGKYKGILSPEQSGLLNILLHETSGLSITLKALTEQTKENKTLSTRSLTFDILNNKAAIHTSFKNNHFAFEIPIKLNIEITHNTLSSHSNEKLEGRIANELQKEYSSIFKKLQKIHADPLGFGTYARSFEYKNWKKIQDHWVSEWEKAEVTVLPIIKIIHTGVIQ